jgi:hypothetical protein
MALFDRLGNFLGPITETTEEYSMQRYVIRIEEDSMGLMRRKNLKPGDYVYYYDCDRLHPKNGDLNRELSLLELKRQNRASKSKRSKDIKDQIMNGVISNLKDLRIDGDSKIADELIEDDQRSVSKNSRTIISMVMNSHCNNSKIGSAKEKQKRRKYKKAKARMFIHQITDGEANAFAEAYKRNEEMDDELCLGKREPQSNMSRKDRGEQSFVKSSEYSGKSTDTDRKNYIEDEFLFRSASMRDDTLGLAHKYSLAHSILGVSEMDQENLH